MTPPSPIIAADAPGMPPPGPDMLAEVARTSPQAERPFDAQVEHLMLQASRGEVLPDGLGEEFRKAACSKSDTRRKTAAKKATKFLEGLHNAAAAKVTAERLTDLYRLALYDPNFTLPIRVKAMLVSAPFVIGHLLGDKVPGGPRPAEVMIVGKHPGSEELVQKRNFVGKASEPWKRAIEELGAQQVVQSWYITNLIRHGLVDPSATTLRKAWIENCLPLLHAELRLVRPKFILCLGADAAKSLLGEKISVTKARNQIFEYSIPGDDAETMASQLVVIPHPAAAYHDPTVYDDYKDAFAGFLRLLEQGSLQRQRIRSRRHVNIYTDRGLKQVVDNLLAQPDSNVLAMDCEWGEKLRTIQFSPRAGEAYAVVLRNEGDQDAFQPNVDAALPHLIRLCKNTPGRAVRVGGHFFRADLPWLIAYGLDLRPEFEPARSAAATKWEGGFDTAYALHAVWEAGRPFELETYAVRLLGTPRYDKPLNDWISEHCKTQKISKASMVGYRDVPNEYLLGNPEKDPPLPNYACYDASVTRELWDVLNGIDDVLGLLDCDKHGLNSRGGFWCSQLASLGFLEMEMRGMLADRGRIDKLTEVFVMARAERLASLRNMIKWPDFNPDSQPQVSELIFGDRYNGKGRRLRPEGALSLELPPIKSTGKGGQSKMFERVPEESEELYNWSTDKEVQGIYSYQSPVVKLLRDVKFLGQSLKYPLKRPLLDPNTGETLRDEHGFNQYDGGIASFIGKDGRVRTHFYPVETGRCSSSKTNLQNFSSGREEDYERLLGDSYPFAVRSIFKAVPGHVLVKTDIKSAELLVVAKLSNDRQMLEDVERALLPESNPHHADMHAMTAIRAFKLDCEPTKAAIAAVGGKNKRKAAKNQKFGRLYKRGITALVRQCREEGVDISEEEMAELVAADEAAHPDVVTYLDAAEKRVVMPGFLTNPFGRHRRAGISADKEVVEAMCRQFRNFEIQSTVADIVSTAMWRLYKFRQEYQGPHTFHFLLQLHDELDFEVPIPSLEWFVDDVLPIIKQIQVPVTDFDGRPTGLPPFHVDIDTSVYLHWGERIPTELGLELGIPSRFLGQSDD